MERVGGRSMGRVCLSQSGSGSPFYVARAVGGTAELGMECSYRNVRIAFQGSATGGVLRYA
jgi:hypothetical protein